MSVQFSDKDKDKIVDSFIWKKATPTYSQVLQLSFASESDCKEYAQRRWGHEIGARGITIRSRKLWEAIRDHLHPSNNESIPNSLWKVHQYASDLEEAKTLEVSSYKLLSTVENGYFTLGWVIADNQANAKIAAMIILGPRAHHSSLRFTREGISTWDVAKQKNLDHAKHLAEAVKSANSVLRIKTHEIETLTCQISFLEIGATFESTADKW